MPGRPQALPFVVQQMMRVAFPPLEPPLVAPFPPMPSGVVGMTNIVLRSAFGYDNPGHPHLARLGTGATRFNAGA